VDLDSGMKGIAVAKNAATRVATRAATRVAIGVERVTFPRVLEVVAIGAGGRWTAQVVHGPPWTGHGWAAPLIMGR